MTACLCIGRGANLPVALEGALKLRELVYVHAYGCAAGELKHGPIALVAAQLPVICIAPQDAWRDKMLSQIQQVRAREGLVVAVATEGDTQIEQLADQVLWLPPTPWRLAPLVSVVPLQLLAYHSALLRDLDVDQPRNLAKSVTVE
jgi:glucosamine--fructose-6-phosphate aminotransferase (isomerizing)